MGMQVMLEEEDSSAAEGMLAGQLAGAAPAAVDAAVALHALAGAAEGWMMPVDPGRAAWHSTSAMGVFAAVSACLDSSGPVPTGVSALRVSSHSAAVVAPLCAVWSNPEVVAAAAVLSKVSLGAEEHAAAAAAVAAAVALSKVSSGAEEHVAAAAVASGAGRWGRCQGGGIGCERGKVHNNRQVNIMRAQLVRLWGLTTALSCQDGAKSLSSCIHDT